MSCLLFLRRLAPAGHCSVRRNVYGTAPLYGNNVWLHLGCAVIGLFFSLRPGLYFTDIGMQEQMNPHLPSS